MMFSSTFCFEIGRKWVGERRVVRRWLLQRVENYHEAQSLPSRFTATAVKVQHRPNPGETGVTTSLLCNNKCSERKQIYYSRYLPSTFVIELSSACGRLQAN